MQLIILKDNLKKALSRAERAVTENNNLPILKNILLSADSNLKISATNLEIGLVTTAAAKINQKGKITIPFAPFFNIVTNSNSERISLESHEDSLVVKTDNYEAKLQGVSSEEFPIIPSIEEEKIGYIEISSQLFSDALSQVSLSAQISELKPELSGVLLDFQIGQIKLVATDSYRLSEKTIQDQNFKTTLKEAFKVIIPLNTVTEFSRVFSESEEVKVFIEEGQVLFKSNDNYLISRLIDGDYPDYQVIIPEKTETELALERVEFLNALKLVNSFSGRTNDIQLELSENEKALQLYSSNQSIGENKYLVPVKKSGSNLEKTSFNARYLIDGLKSFKAENVTLSLNSSQKPALLKPSGDNSIFYIVMPLES
ncbi:MAG: DNA polymerase III subunit beta [Candidatus Harrisonbacteria bacterium CG10_big_fil_rev_8_21_14_0_10_44_23]|uniref:Beta sliding clamp n=1 Tax=Candidatus Harrisonbacteria bacterium CG10_big_fil_rev_8_21_14_0_10_44_23 TaxID=1974585 RepID=A0A2H0UPS7_9BACT|nr:MAG: DNA polymerase III subunit beta [Candidatus Harrisonbacteria bacterium CG10_big_fil_rev_8_21_14_0_10_44_23]